MRSLLRNVTLCLATVALAAPAAADGIRILSAQYGDPRSGELCDAAAPIASLCDGRSQCSFDVRNTALCGDPSFGVVKQLDVTYTCGVGYYKTRVSEYDTSKLACQ